MACILWASAFWWTLNGDGPSVDGNHVDWAEVLVAALNLLLKPQHLPHDPVEEGSEAASEGTEEVAEALVTVVEGSAVAEAEVSVVDLEEIGVVEEEASAAAVEVSVTVEVEAVVSEEVEMSSVAEASGIPVTYLLHTFTD